MGWIALETLVAYDVSKIIIDQCVLYDDVAPNKFAFCYLQERGPFERRLRIVFDIQKIHSNLFGNLLDLGARQSRRSRP
jgi:hypothetical protein